MSELNLSPQKQKEYDALMAEIEAELSKIPLNFQKKVTLN